MFHLMCWPCLTAYYREHGSLPPVGYQLKTNGTETGVSVWFGQVVCRVHAEERILELGVGFEDD
jgi:hypothetical protein